MAKKEQEAPTQALAAQSENALAVAEPGQIPSFIPTGSIEGAENISPDDARIPRLVLAQPMTPQATKGDPLYIESLTAGVSFNDLTGEIYGDGPIDIIVVRADNPRYVEFSDVDRSVIDPNVKFGDPRTQFTTNEKGERVRPVATTFFDFIILMGSKLEPLALSFKGSAIKLSARPLNGLIKAKAVPVYAQIYRLIPKMMKNDKGTWYVYLPKQVGMIGNEATFHRAQEAFAIFKIKKVDFDAAPPTDGSGPDAEDPAADAQTEM